MIAQTNDEIQEIECMTVVGGLSFVPAGAFPVGFQANRKARRIRARVSLMEIGLWRSCDGCIV